MHNLMPGNIVMLGGRMGTVFERGALDITYYVKVRWHPTKRVETFINNDILKLVRIDG